MSNICPYLQPITFHCQRSMYALIMLMRLIHLRIHFSYEVGQRGFVKLSMQSAPCQCKVHNINAKCTMLMQSAKCTTSMMLYKQKQPPLKVRASAMLLFQSIHASMRVKINNDLTVTHVATDVIKNSPLYKDCKLWSLLSTISTLLPKATLVVEYTKKSKKYFQKVGYA